MWKNEADSQYQLAFDWRVKWNNVKSVTRPSKVNLTQNIIEFQPNWRTYFRRSNATTQKLRTKMKWNEKELAYRMNLSAQIHLILHCIKKFRSMWWSKSSNEMLGLHSDCIKNDALLVAQLRIDESSFRFTRAENRRIFKSPRCIYAPPISVANFTRHSLFNYLSP